MGNQINWNTNPEYDRIILEGVKENLTFEQIAKLIPGANYKKISHRVSGLRRKGLLPVYNSATVEVKKEQTEDVIKISKKEIPNFTKELGQLITGVVEDLNLEFKEIPLEAKYKKDRQEHTSILDISDVHLGETNQVFDSKLRKNITTYNYNIYLQELQVLRDTVYRLHHIQSQSFNLKTLYINLLGDILTNDRIFEGQAFHIDFPVGEQLWKGVFSLFGFINDMKKVYEQIVVTGVVGNHGRSSSNPKLDEVVENNFEYHLYKILQLMFRDDKRVEVNVPITRCHIVNINGWKHMLTHGDMFRGSGKAALEKQIQQLGWNVGEFQAIDFGHFHFIDDTDIGDKILVKQNGSWILKDNYALKNYKLYSIPKQHFYGCSKKRKEVWSYKVDLRVGGEQ
jgi:hypothetical protein